MDKVEGFLEVGTNGRREVVINVGEDKTGHIVFSPNQARHLAELLLRKASDADGQLRKPAPPQQTPGEEKHFPAKRVAAFGKYGVYTPYDSHDDSVSWTVQRFDPATDSDVDLGDFLAECVDRYYAELLAEAAFESDEDARLDA